MILDMIDHGQALMEVGCPIHIDTTLKNLSFKTNSDYECFW